MTESNTIQRNMKLIFYVVIVFYILLVFTYFLKHRILKILGITISGSPAILK